MNAVKPIYDEVARSAQPAANAGFREGRNPPECALTFGALREDALDNGRAIWWGFADKGGFFNSIVRRVQRAVEARVGVPAEVTSVVMALHDSLEVSFDSGEGLTHGTESDKGDGQGDTCGPTRSMEPLAVEKGPKEWQPAPS